MAKTKKNPGPNEVQALYDARESALRLLKQSAADLDRLLSKGIVKVGDRFTVKDPAGEKEIVIVDNFAESNFIWRPLLVERFKFDDVKYPKT